MSEATSDPQRTTGRSSDSGVNETRTDDPVILIKDLRKTFGGGEIVACEDINLDIYDDDFVVLLGPSGCGKTTTLRCISGLEIPDEGSIIINDEDMTGVKPKNRNLAFVFQSIALFPHKNVRENLRFGLDMTGEMPKEERNERVEEIAEILGIEDMLDRSPDELSGGQQQRVSLGRAMVMEPAAFLLDEPFSALDAKLRNQMQIEVKELQRRLNTPMVFVTHDQEEAMTLGDKIVIMNDGRIQQIGSPHEVFNEPTNRFVAEFIGSPAVNTFDSQLTRTAGEPTLENEFFQLSIDGLRDVSFDTQRVFLGIRPQYLSVASEEDALFTGRVKLVEPKGDRDAIFLDLDGQEVRAVVPQNTVENGDEVPIRFDREKLWLFTEDGDRLV
jgi:multiple sugar transport system ATP-binding protein